MLPRLGPTLAVAAALIAALIFAKTANGYYVFILATMALYAMVGIGLNILIGLTGQVSFGHVGFYAIGAYTVAVMTTTLHVPFVVALAAGALISGVAGALLALPAPIAADVAAKFQEFVESLLKEDG